MVSSHFGKNTGYYSLKSLKSYFLVNSKCISALDRFLPEQMNKLYFSDARYALYYCLLHLKEKNKIKSIAFPVWTCSIIKETVEKAGLKTVLLDIDPLTLELIDDNSVKPTKGR